MQAARVGGGSGFGLVVRAGRVGWSCGLVARVYSWGLASGGAQCMSCGYLSTDLNFADMNNAPVAQLDRALPSEGRGQRFESSRVHQSPCFTSLKSP